MATLLHELIFEQASRRPEAVAIAHRQAVLDYAGLAQQVQAAACGLLDLDLKRSERVAVYLPKQFETVVALFAAAAAGAVFVPVNPLLKPEQVMHILRDCNVRILITARGRADRLNLDPAACPDLRALVLVDEPIDPPARQALQRLRWQTLLAAGSDLKPARVIDLDMAAILYTSGSTGKPKGVVLSHRNMLSGAYSVTRYLDNRADDRLLAILPFSFDYGLSQLTTAFVVGARGADGLSVAARCHHRRRARRDHRSGGGAADVGATGAVGLAGGGGREPALLHQFGRRDATRHPECVAPALARDHALFDVRSDRGVSLHLSAA